MLKTLLPFLLAGFPGIASAQLLYIANTGDGTLSSYIYDQDSGGLTEILPRVTANGVPNAIAIHPSGKFALVSDGGGFGSNGPSLTMFSIDPGTGALKQVDSGPLVPGSGPQGVTVDPSGKFAYVAQQGNINGTSLVSAFAIDVGAGKLTAVPGSPFTAPMGANCVVVHPNGKFAYVSAVNAGQIAVFSIGDNGALSPITGSPFAARLNIAWMAMDPGGKFLYVPERQDPGILSYSVNATTGAITPLAGSPLTLGQSFLSGAAIDSAGKTLFVSNAGGVVYGYQIGVAGGLTPIPPGFFPSIGGSNAVILDPGGKYLFVPGDSASNNIATFAINADTGALQARGQLVQTGANPTRGAAVVLDPPLAAPIVIESVYNFFSHAPQGMPNSAIAQGARMGISGKSIGPGVPASAGETFSTELGGVSVKIQTGDTATDCLMVNAANSLVTCLVPSTTPTGDASVTVTYHGRSTDPFPVSIAGASPGIGTRNNIGYGPAVVWKVPDVVRLAPDPNLLTNPSTLDNSVAPGKNLVIQGTGLGPVNGDETDANIFVVLDTPVEVLAGGKQAKVMGAVRTAQGIDYIVFQVPSDTPQGCYVPLAVRVGGILSNTGSISVALSGASCSDPTGLSASDIDIAVKNGRLNVGAIQVSHLDLGGPNDEISGNFRGYTLDNLRAAYTPGAADAGIRPSFAVPPTGTCTVTPGTPNLAYQLDIPGDRIPTQGLNAGASLNLIAPGGRYQAASPSYHYASGQDYVFKPGDYAADNGTGTANVGALKAALTMPPAVNWTNAGSFATVDRSKDLTFTWTGGLAGKELVFVGGLVQNSQVAAAFLCAENVTAGKFTVPSWVLSALPASDPNPGQNPPGIVVLATAPYTSVGRFSVQGLDFGVFTYEQGGGVIAQFQ